MKFATLPDLPSDDDEDDSDYSTQTDEQMLRDMMHEDDESEYNDSEADGQTAEELLEELKEEHGTVTSPTRCGSVLPLHFVSNLAARQPGQQLHLSSAHAVPSGSSAPQTIYNLILCYESSCILSMLTSCKIGQGLSFACICWS